MVGDAVAGPGKICVSIAESSIDQALTVAKSVAPAADVIEIRLDTLENPAIEPFMAELSGPLLFTNRPEWEGGSFAGLEETRVGLLRQAIEAGAAYVDIELRADEALRHELRYTARKSGTRIIISWHDFTGTPPTNELINIFRMQYQAEADIGKIATMAHSPRDVLRVLDLQSHATDLNFPLIAFCMGRAGAISRVATLELGGFMTYAAPENGKTSAPGQLPVTLIKSIHESLDHAN